MDAAIVETKTRLALESGDAPVVCAYLFGSYATSRATRDSDVDVAVLLDGTAAGSIDTLSRLRGALERALGLEVDLVDMRTAPPDLVHRILRDGHLLVDRDPPRRISFEVRVLRPASVPARVPGRADVLMDDALNVVRDILDNRLADRVSYVASVRRQLASDAPR